MSGTGPNIEIWNMETRYTDKRKTMWLRISHHFLIWSISPVHKLWVNMKRKLYRSPEWSETLENNDSCVHCGHTRTKTRHIGVCPIKPHIWISAVYQIILLLTAYCHKRERHCQRVHTEELCKSISGCLRQGPGAEKINKDLKVHLVPWRNTSSAGTRQETDPGLKGTNALVDCSLNRAS